MLLLIAYVLLALGVSFLCSILESVLLSVSPPFLARLQKDEHPAAPRLLQLKTNVDRPLAAILSLNTIAHTVGAAGAGAQAQVLWGSEVLAITSAVLTLLILVLSEIVPKTLGALYWRRLAPPAARILPILIWTLYPLVILSERLTRVFGREQRTKGALSREEIAAVAQLGAEQGLFRASEGRILRSLFRFGDLRARDVMTPRIVVQSVRDGSTVRELLQSPDAMRFSRIPLWHDTQDDIVGYVLKDDALLAAARDGLDREVGSLKRDMLIVPESMPLPDLFENLLNSREQIALVVDEFGGTAGLASLEDVLETLLGLEIVDELDATRDMRDLARARWRERARRLGLVEDPA